MKNIKKIATILLLVIALMCFVSCDNNTPTKYTVTFDSNGGTAIESYKTARLNKIPKPAKQGFHFVNWYYNPDFDGNPAVFNATVLKDITLYAKFEKGIFEIVENDEDNTCKITDLYYCPLDKNIVFPSTVEKNGKTYTVTEIDITAPNSNMLYLNSIKFAKDFIITNLPLYFENVDTIDFTNLTSLENISVLCQNLQSLVLPNIETIPTNFLTEALNLKTLVLPQTLKTIENKAFSNCAFASVNIPESVEKIGNNAFNNCLFLENIVINSNSVIELDTKGITNVLEIIKPNNNKTKFKIYIKDELLDNYKAKYNDSTKFNFIGLSNKK